MEVVFFLFYNLQYFKFVNLQTFTIKFPTKLKEAFVRGNVFFGGIRFG